MRTPLFILLFVITAPISALSAQSPCPDSDPHWADCQEDKDCVIELNECYAVAAFHRKHLAAVRKYNECIRPMIRCVRPPADDAEKTVAVCRNQACAAIKPDEAAQRDAK
jgi:hypothetical protein